MANKPTLDEMRLALSRVTRPPQQTNLDMAREEAERIGQHHDPHTRSLQQGYEHDWYHGGTGDVKAFDPKTLGESTGAASAKKGFFFARDPSTPPPEMLEHDPESVEFLKKLGKPIPPKKTMEGHGSATASSYAGTGGSREYKEAMRMAKAAERVGNWSEHEKYMQIAEDAVINDMRYRQDLVAKHGDARDQMYEDIKNAWYGPHNAEMFKGMSQPDYEAHDKRYKELMPYGWHIDYKKPHYDVLKKELQKFGKHKQIESALKSINHYQSVHNERKLSELESGANVMPVALRYKNPMYHDFKGNSYRDQTYSDLMDEAKRKGHDALILKNTFDPGGSGTPKMVDVGVMFHPNQVRSKFAAFDPTRTHESDLLAAKGGVVSLLRKHGRPVDSDLDAMRKMSNGHRVFIAHEQDEKPREITSVSEMHGYTPDQIYTVDPQHFAQHKAKGGNVMPKYPSIEEMLQKLQESGRTPIMPAPDRWFKKPEQHPFQQKAIEKLLAYTGHNREAFPHGAHINPLTGEPLDFEIMNDLGVAIDPMTGTPRMSGIKSGLTEIDPKLGSLTKSNLIRKGLFKHEGGDPLLDRIKFLATIEKSGKGHHYGLSTHYESPAELVQEMRGNPTLRPHSRGDIYGVGDEVGRISIKGMHHPVFEKLVVAPSGMNVQGKKLHKANGGKVTHAHHLEIEERPL